jgi:hypothetical protein
MGGWSTQFGTPVRMWQCNGAGRCGGWVSSKPQAVGAVQATTGSQTSLCVPAHHQVLSLRSQHSIVSGWELCKDCSCAAVLAMTACCFSRQLRLVMHIADACMTMTLDIAVSFDSIWEPSLGIVQGDRTEPVHPAQLLLQAMHGR